MKQESIAYCGIICSQCEYKEKIHCPGCKKAHELNGKPFWGECKVAQCNMNKSLNNCSECDEFPCKLLKSFAYDEKQGDNGQRIRNLESIRK